AVAVLRQRARGHVHVDVARLEELRIDAGLAILRLRKAERRLRALLHDVAELPREDELAAPGRAGRLDEKEVAAHWCPGETGRDRGQAGALRQVRSDPGLTY